MSMFTVPRAAFPPPPAPVFPPSLAERVRVAASLPQEFTAPVYIIFEAVFRKVSIFAAVPVRVMDAFPEPETVTPPPDEAPRLPELTLRVSVTVFAPASASEKLVAEKSTLLAVFSSTVISEGRPLMVGSSLSGLMTMLNMVVPTVPPSPSETVKVKLSARVSSPL